MTALIRVSNRVTPNPIEWQETQHQQRSISDAARRYWFMTPLLLIFAVVVIGLTLVDVSAQTRNMDALPSILMAGVLLGGMLVTSLLVTWWAIRRDGALRIINH